MAGTLMHEFTLQSGRRVRLQAFHYSLTYAGSSEAKGISQLLSVGVATVLRARHCDDALLVVDLVQDAIASRAHPKQSLTTTGQLLGIERPGIILQSVDRFDYLVFVLAIEPPQVLLGSRGEPNRELRPAACHISGLILS